MTWPLGGSRSHDEIGVTLLAALARLSIERGAPVAARALAALAGVTTISVRRRVAAGELDASDEIAEEILPTRARWWRTSSWLLERIGVKRQERQANNPLAFLAFLAFPFLEHRVRDRLDVWAPREQLRPPPLRDEPRFG